jgi:tetratricopeptide (TPR) repeat protein
MRRRCRRYPGLLPLIAVGLTFTLPQSSLADTGTNDEVITTHSLVGSYLAGRFARANQDQRNAAEFYRKALIHDPGNERLLEQAFQMEASQADWPRALKLADELTKLQPKHRLAHLALALEDFKSGSRSAAAEHFRAAGTGPIGELTSSLALAWVKAADKDYTGALASLDLPKQAEWAQFFLRFHRALISDVAGRGQDSKRWFDQAFKQDTRTLRTALAYARSSAHWGNRKLAKTVLKSHLAKSQGDGHPLIRTLAREVRAGRKPALIVSTPREGLAEVFYGLGEALIGEGAIGIGVLYMQMALYVEPDQQFALAALANAHETNKEYADAIAVYDRIPKESPLETAVEIRKAFNLNSLERVDEAKKTLTGLLERAGPVVPDDVAKDLAADAADRERLLLEAAEQDAAAADDETLLKLGSRGAKVLELQESLKTLGYPLETADGRFGESTRRAVVEFQKNNAIKADGLAGPETVAALLSARDASSNAAKSGSTDVADATPPDGGKEPLPESTKKLPLTINDRLEILDALGNITRSRKMYGEAVGYYDRALALIDKPEKRHWVYFYARGTSYERLKNWPAAEVDLEKALGLFPDQPLILNYLGYSWIDQGRNMKRGMALIEKAVALKPDDGYVVDSLGWAHFKQGNFKEAVRYLERAVELKPNDPVLNDHLGDALWKVGREREARFQWDQALSLKPEPEDAIKIRRKLDQGMTQETDAAKTKKTSQVGTPAN